MTFWVGTLLQAWLNADSNNLVHTNLNRVSSFIGQLKGSQSPAIISYGCLEESLSMGEKRELKILQRQRNVLEESPQAKWLNNHQSHHRNKLVGNCPKYQNPNSFEWHRNQFHFLPRYVRLKGKMMMEISNENNTEMLRRSSSISEESRPSVCYNLKEFNWHLPVLMQIAKIRFLSLCGATSNILSAIICQVKMHVLELTLDFIASLRG